MILAADCPSGHDVLFTTLAAIMGALHLSGELAADGVAPRERYPHLKVKFTLPVGITWFRAVPMDNNEPREHLLMAASVTITLPAAILFFAAQRFFISGIVMTGLKG